MNTDRPGFPALAILSGIILAVFAAFPANAGILNDDEFGTLEIIDFSVIENAADMFGPVGLSFNVSRGGPLRPGDEIRISYHGLHDRWVSILDYSADRIVKPLVINERTRLTDGGLERTYTSVVGESIGPEYVLMIITGLPITDERLEQIALAPNEIELNDEILSVSVNDFTVVVPWNDPDTVVDWGESMHGGVHGAEFIELDEFATFIEYPLNTYPYNPWSYMYLYPYARLRPQAYVEKYGPFSQVHYVIPSGEGLTSNFWSYASMGWVDDSIWVIPPGGYWQGSLRFDDPYTDYFLRILPHLVQENNSYMRLQVEINGTLVQPSIDITSAIGWGEYWTTDPFAYYNLRTLLHQGDNDIRLYWPEGEEENLELQMVDMLPQDLMDEELGETEEAEEASNQGFTSG